MDFVPGLLQGLTRTLISYPFDFAKVQLQKDKYVNSKDFIKNYFKTHRPLSLYRGCRLPVIIVSIDRSVQYKYFEDFNQKVNPYVAGAFTGVLASTYHIPMQYINANVILDPVKTSWQFTKDILYLHGIKEFYKGGLVETLRNVMGGGLYMGTYASIRDQIGNGAPQAVIAAGLASWLNWSVIYPLDLVRTKYQTSTGVTIAQILSNQTSKSILGLWKGIFPIYLRTFPSACIGMLVYEKTRDLTKSHI